MTFCVAEKLRKRKKKAKKKKIIKKRRSSYNLNIPTNIMHNLLVANKETDCERTEKTPILKQISGILQGFVVSFLKATIFGYNFVFCSPKF